MNTVHIKLYDLFRKELNLSDDKAKAFVEAIDEVISEDVKVELPVFKSLFKEDFNQLSKQTDEVRNATRDVDQKVERETSRLELKISETKTDIIRWMLAFWFGQIAIIAGLLMYFLKK